MHHGGGHMMMGAQGGGGGGSPHLHSGTPQPHETGGPQLREEWERLRRLGARTRSHSYPDRPSGGNSLLSSSSTTSSPTASNPASPSASSYGPSTASSAMGMVTNVTNVTGDLSATSTTSAMASGAQASGGMELDLGGQMPGAGVPTAHSHHHHLPSPPPSHRLVQMPQGLSPPSPSQQQQQHAGGAQQHSSQQYLHLPGSPGDESQATRRLVRGRRRAGSEASAFGPPPLMNYQASGSPASPSMSSPAFDGEQGQTQTQTQAQAQARTSLAAPPLHHRGAPHSAMGKANNLYSSPLAQHNLTSAQYYDEMERLNSPLLGEPGQQHTSGLQLPVSLPTHQMSGQHSGQSPQRQNSGIVLPSGQSAQRASMQNYNQQVKSELEQEMDEDAAGLADKGEPTKREGGLREPTGTVCPDFTFNLQGLYPAELREDGVRFSVMYQVHYARIFEEADAVRLDGIREAVTSFWPKTRRFFSLFQSPIIVHQILNIDYMLYDALVNMLVPDPFRCVAPEVSSAIIELSRQYPAWLHNAIQFAIPLALTDAKIRAVKYFCRTLHKRAMISNLGGRLTNHLNGVHLTPDQRHRWSLQLHQQGSGTNEDNNDISSLSRRRMLQDWMGLDFAFIAAQTSLFDTPDRPYSVPLPSTLLQDITQLLAHEAGVEQWSEWLHGSILANHIFAGERKESSAKVQGDLIHDFVLKWSFFSANVQQELTAMQAETLKVFRLLFQWVEAVLNHHMELSWKNRGPADSVGGVPVMAHQPPSVMSGGISPTSVTAPPPGTFSPSLMRRRPSPPDLVPPAPGIVSGEHYHSMQPTAVPAHVGGYGMSSPFGSPTGSPALPGSPMPPRPSNAGMGAETSQSQALANQQGQRLYMQQKHNPTLASLSTQGGYPPQHVGFTMPMGGQQGYWSPQGYQGGASQGYYVAAPKGGQFLPAENAQSLKQQMDYLSHKLDGRTPHSRAHRKHSNSFTGASSQVSVTVTPPTTPPSAGQMAPTAQRSHSAQSIQPTMPIAAQPYPLKQMVQTRPRSLSQPVGMAPIMPGAPSGHPSHQPSGTMLPPQRPATFEDAGISGPAGSSSSSTGYRPLISSPLAQHSLSPRSPQNPQSGLSRQQPHPNQAQGGQMRGNGEVMDFSASDGGGDVYNHAMLGGGAGGSSSMGAVAPQQGVMGAGGGGQSVRRTLSK